MACADWFRALRKLIDEHDVLVLPTAQVFPFPKNVHWPERSNDRPMDTWHRWVGYRSQTCLSASIPPA